MITKIKGKCPRCSSNIFEDKKKFYCSNKECSFALWKDDKFWSTKKTTLTRLRAESLIEYGEVKVNNLYSAKKNIHYDAYVVLEDDGAKSRFSLNFYENEINKAASNKTDLKDDLLLNTINNLSKLQVNICNNISKKIPVDKDICLQAYKSIETILSSLSNNNDKYNSVQTHEE